MTTVESPFLVTGVGDRALVSIQKSFRLSGRSEPEPDIAVLRRRPDYRSVDVGPDDVVLLIEVADTSLEYDREVKLPLYAQAGIPEVWIVDLGGELVEVYRRPGREGYQHAQLVRRGQRVVCEGLPDLVVPVDEIL